MKCAVKAIRRRKKLSCVEDKEKEREKKKKKTFGRATRITNLFR